MAKITRRWAGIAVEGAGIDLLLTPSGAGIGVHVVAHASVTGFDQSCSLGDESIRAQAYRISEIDLHADRISCMTAKPYAPQYREGCSLDLEPGMADALRPWLPKLDLAASVSRSIEARVAELLLPPGLHMFSFIHELVGCIVLDGLNAPDALRLTESLHWAGKDARFMSVFEDDKVLQLLQTATKVN